MGQKHTEAYDYIFTGGGAAGLSLALHLADSPLRDKRMLIIDLEKKNQNDRTWCFWSDQPSRYQPILYRSWDEIAFESDTFSRTYTLAPFRYHMLRGMDFYRHAQATLRSLPNVTFLQAPVESVQDGSQYAQVTAGGQTYAAEWVFNSLFRSSEFKITNPRYHDVKQHFKGWEIETETDVFNPQRPTMFDFRTPQHGVMRFVYILPFSPRQALVEYTLFSADLLPPAEYDLALQAYIHDVLKLTHYRIEAEESGVIPMTDQPFPRRAGQRILNIGTIGGRVKPSTGYAFLRIQRDSAAVVRSLTQHHHPFHIPADPALARFNDRIMLQLMQRQGPKMKGIFTDLFMHNPIQRLFRFLNEDATLGENILLMASLNPWPFLSALFKLIRSRQV